MYMENKNASYIWCYKKSELWSLCAGEDGDGGGWGGYETEKAMVS